LLVCAAPLLPLSDCLPVVYAPMYTPPMSSECLRDNKNSKNQSLGISTPRLSASAFTRCLMRPQV
jgi:hypothetical protein